MRKTLLVGGDSFSDQDCRSYADTDIITWPILLAEKLDMDLVCVAQSGAGNEQIYSSILDWICENGSDDIGMVIAGWSKSERMDYEVLKFRYTEPWYNTRVSPRGDIYGWIRKSIRNFYNLQTLCENHNIPYKQFQMISLFVTYLSEYYKNDFTRTRMDCIDYLNQSPQFDMIYPQNFIGWPLYKEHNGFVVGDQTVHQGWTSDNKLANDILESSYYKSVQDPYLKYVVSDTDPHPNKAGHELIMEFVYEYL